MEIMSQFLGTALTLVLGLFSGGQSTHRVEYTCAAPEWTTAPKMEGGMFKGVVAVECNFKSAVNKGYAHLASHLNDRIRKEATEIHEGPVEKQLKGMPATYYDATFVQEADGNELTLRSDVYVGTNSIDMLTFTQLSKSVEGTGQAKYIKKLDNDLTVKNAATAGNYVGRLSLLLNIQKPGIVPAEMFKNRVKEEVEKMIVEREPKLIEDVGNNL